MTAFKVTKRVVEEQYFYVEVDTTDIDDEYVISHGCKEVDQLQNLLIKANLSAQTVESNPRTSWVLSAVDGHYPLKITGKLELVKKFFAKVQFKVTHTMSRLVAVQAPTRKEAMDILCRNLDDDTIDIIDSLNDEIYSGDNLDESDYEVLEWASSPEDLTSSYRTPVKIYTQED